MDVKQKAAAARIYQDFEPLTGFTSENDRDTLLVYVPGFEKEQLRVQLAKTRELIISGERLVGDNTWQRFQKTVAVSPNCDMDKITAKFKVEDQILHIIQPKLITSERKQDHEKLVTTNAQTPELQKSINEKKHPDNVNDESRRKATTLTDPEFSTYQTGDTTANGESSDYKKMDGYVAKDDKMERTKSQKHEPDSDSMCRMDERAKKGLAVATNVKMPRQVINLVLAVLLAIALGLMVKYAASFWKEDEN